MLKNTAGQRKRVFAYDASGQPVTGDADNITATFELDNAAPAATDDLHPTEAGGGFYDFDMTKAETNCDRHATVATSSTPGVLVIGVPGVEHPSVNIAPSAPYNSKNERVELTRLSDYKTGTPVGPLLIPITANNVTVGDTVRFVARLPNSSETISIDGTVVSSDGALYGSFEIEGDSTLDKTASDLWRWGMRHVNGSDDESAVASDKPMWLFSDLA